MYSSLLDKEVIKMKDEIIESVRKSIMIKSVEDIPKENMPFGEGVHNVLNYALNLSEQLGFKSVNLENMVGYCEYGRGDEMTVVLGHLDVVPEGDGWTYPAYGAEVHDNKIYGRGIVDDKGCTIGSLYALKAIQNLKLPLKRRIRIIFGTNEETGSKGVKYYVAKGEEIPVSGFTPDAQYPIINGEKGGASFTFHKSIKSSGRLRIKSMKGGTANNIVPSYAEACLDICDEDVINRINNFVDSNNSIEFDKDNLIIKAHGISAHASIPETGKNAITMLFNFLDKLNYDESLFKGELKDFLDFINNKIGDETNGKSLGINIRDDISGELTLNVGTMNADKDGVTFTFDIRYPITKKYEDFSYILQSQIKNANIEILKQKHVQGIYTDPNKDFIKKLQKVYEEKTGEKAELMSIGGGTYAKSMPNIVAFGPIFKGDKDLDHQPNEYMEIDKLIKNIQIIAEAMYELAN